MDIRVMKGWIYRIVILTTVSNIVCSLTCIFLIIYNYTIQLTSGTSDMTTETPINFWELLVTKEMLEGIVEQTNLYAQQYISGHTLKPRSRIQQWVRSSFTVADLLRFLAITIIMGIISYPRLEDYWTTSWPFSSTTISSIMSRDRFSLIMRFLHLNDSTQYVPKGQTGYDPLYKIRPFVNKLLDRFKQSYTPGRELSIDESMIGFKGRLSFIQYLPKKPTKWGLKAFVLADSRSGYTLNWQLYTGEHTNL